MGVHVDSQQLAAYVAEVETGYDVDELRRRGRGRPGRGAEPSQVIAVRLTMEELELVDQLAEKLRMNRSEAIRAAITRTAKT